jgi:glyoxylase-like metal-dependent hydrolase (beta-lactamase superfamily II)
VAHEGDKRLVRQASLYALRFCRLAMHPPARLDYFEGTPSFAAAGADWRTISTPGHTRGSVCYLGAGMVFVGDLLFRDSVGPAARPEGDPELLNQSISGLLGALADDVVISRH